MDPSVKNPVLLYLCNIDDSLVTHLKDDYTFECCLRKLPLAEHQPILSSKYSREKALVARLFLVYVLNRVLESPDVWSPLLFSYNSFGKPMLENTHFNASSSNKLLCVAVTGQPVGVDLSHEEQNVSPNDFMAQFDGIFHDLEKAQLEAIRDPHCRYVAFNHLWTLKESYGKYMGCGINYDLSKACFRLAQLNDGWAENNLDNSNLHCYSAVAKHSKLPVIVSVVVEAPLVIQTVEVDMGHVIQSISS